MGKSKPNMKSALMIGFNPSAERQSEDFYATNPKALELFLERITKDKLILRENIWECACGQGHLSKVLIENGFKVKSTDIIDRGYGGVKDFFEENEIFNGDILTNPPFKLAEEFIEKGMSILTKGSRLILFLKIQFLESKSRYILFKKYPPKYVYLHSSRQLCCKDGDFDKYTSTTQFYAWYIFEKGFNGETILRWIKPELNDISADLNAPKGVNNGNL
jgi:hypothetical protein